MRFSQLFTKTRRENPQGEEAINAQLLERGGFIYKNSAGIYTFLPLGWRVIQNINNIVREEMDAIGGQEMLMQTLVEKKYLDASGRWDVPIGFEAIGKEEKEAGFVLGWTHEEVLTAIASKFISSYRDLPFSAYQIQSKFRNESRAKSGILRGREFLMKDLYSFHESEEDMQSFYGKVKEAYLRTFQRLGLDAIYTVATGGDFTQNFTHEFQVISPVGEDTIHVCKKCNIAVNKEIIDKQKVCPECESSDLFEETSIEVGNIFPLGVKYSSVLGLNFADKDGESKPVVMGSYGIGISRVMGAIVEVHHDDKGIIWPESVAPFKVHLIALDGKSDEGNKIYSELTDKNIDVLYDDRPDVSAGEKFADADLIGTPMRIVISNKAQEEGGIEIKKRSESQARVLPLTGISKIL